MLNFARRNAVAAMATIAFVLSACGTFNDLRPIPNVYAGSESIADRTLVTLKAYGAAQETVITVCDPAGASPLPAEVCVPLIEAEQRVRPGVTAAAQVAAEYADIDARIRELGPNAPAEWLLAAAEIAGRLASAWGPIEADVNQLIGRTGDISQ